MPRIIVMSESGDEREGAISLDEMMSGTTTQPGAVVTLDERVTSADLRSGHQSAQLIERVGWAVHDADDAERADGEAGGPARRRSSSSARRAKAHTN
jgi:hypothetical protein